MCCHSVKTIFEENWKGGRKDRFNKPIDDANFLDILDNHFIPTNSLVFRNIIDEWPSWLKSSNMISGDIPIAYILASHGKLKYLFEDMAVKRINGSGVTADKSRKNKLTYFRYELYYHINQYTKKQYKIILRKKIFRYFLRVLKISIKEKNFQQVVDI